MSRKGAYDGISKMMGFLFALTAGGWVAWWTLWFILVRIARLITFLEKDKTGQAHVGDRTWLNFMLGDDLYWKLRS